MALEIKESKPTMRYKLSDTEGVTTLDVGVSNGQWYRILLER